jgi:hypothetical protein
MARVRRWWFAMVASLIGGSHGALVLQSPAHQPRETAIATNTPVGSLAVGIEQRSREDMAEPHLPERKIQPTNPRDAEFDQAATPTGVELRRLIAAQMTFGPVTPDSETGR